ncbi:b2257 [Wigglesworthia glossinidia endosymbiont of Glossina brevipalpis]|uniref:Undecaprenyl phosphate-alpha-4-amino-4-deoxy-L-arabinose arabinosyl transferase n=1 Tax=Wigglesworthia glossinidia brevipalpis TaxID=36870 RepID=ARNT_WIGBR|nr:RecName: Full=Undecaprenyl phosphate-alpha-4-amino-4-deoxy-L-arabinose arabinosyl transferase; AltName: Full=4-amino-4-deoxy-L-arabinose lipid A transferase; AltName: Full=Lipid IV(A) 4-amino-4-deoxy-L-arabinosyltransferase; AltName: Full=Undecaprenyl phosphate-alpha-L-Ara4N transferase [Wigglesworthia glossinidia endosymbiont of Glossina brevipalpis]BAC24308.1 b2257 [Wigglesworthia glossinidia endosymbiont of Glossina brevipalpis]
MDCISTKNNKINKIKFSITIIAFILLYYLIPLNYRDLWQPDETRYAEISREMLQNKNWSIPYLLDIRYFEKPIFGYWINSISQFFFGHNNFSVRFGSFLFTLFSANLIYLFSKKIWKNKILSLNSVIIFLSILLVYIIGTYSVLDSIISFWINLSMISFWLASTSKVKKYKIKNYIILGISIGIGFITKGFISLLIPFISIFIWLFLTKININKTIIHCFFSLLISILIIFPWIYKISYLEKDFIRYFIFIEHIQRFIGENAQHKSPFWYYFPIFIIGCLPWSGFLFSTLNLAWNTRKNKKIEFYLLLWIIVQFCFFSISKGKLPTYILPCFFPLSILIAKNIEKCNLKNKKKLLKINSIINTIVGSTLLIFIILHEKYKFFGCSLYNKNEYYKLILCIFSIFVWIFLNLCIIFNDFKFWRITSLSIIGIAFLFGLYVPEKIIYAKQPQLFIKEVFDDLESSDFIFSNNIGLSTAISWEIKKNNIFIFENKGELEYGLSYLDSKHRFIKKEDFKNWLSKNKEKKISLVMLLPDKHYNWKKFNVPETKKFFQHERLILLKYNF